MRNYQANKLIVEFIFWLVSICIALFLMGCPDLFFLVIASVVGAFVITVLNQILKEILERVR